MLWPCAKQCKWPRPGINPCCSVCWFMHLGHAGLTRGTQGPPPSLWPVGSFLVAARELSVATGEDLVPDQGSSRPHSLGEWSLSPLDHQEVPIPPYWTVQILFFSRWGNWGPESDLSRVISNMQSPAMMSLLLVSMGLMEALQVWSSPAVPIPQLLPSEPCCMLPWGCSSVWGDSPWASLQGIYCAW